MGCGGRREHARMAATLRLRAARAGSGCHEQSEWQTEERLLLCGVVTATTIRNVVRGCDIARSSRACSGSGGCARCPDALA